MTNDEFMRGLDARHPKGYTTDQVAAYALDVINRLEGMVHTAQTQVTAAQDNAKGFERKAGGEMLMRQNLQMELDELKKKYGVNNG